MIKKILLTLLFLFIAIITAFFIWRYVSYARDKDPHKTFLVPRLELSLVEISSLTSEKTEMTAKMLIKNQMPLSFTADSLQYRVFINDVEVMKSHYKKSITLKSEDSSLISLPVTIFNHDFISVLKFNELKNIDSVEYRLEASFYTDIVFRKKFNVDIKRLLPIIYIPEVKAEHIKIDSLNFSRAAIQLLVSIKNKNGFPLKSKNIAYEFSIEGNKWIKGIISGITDINEKSVTELQIPVRISFKEVSKTLFDLLKKGNKVNYKLRLVFGIESENNMMRKTKVILENSGSVNSLMKDVKKINRDMQK